MRRWLACDRARAGLGGGGLPVSSFTAVAQGTAGTAAEGITLQIGSPSPQNIVFWMERGGQRRYVAWDKCLPAWTCSSTDQEREGLQDIRNLFIHQDRRDRHAHAHARLPQHESLSKDKPHKETGPPRMEAGFFVAGD